MEGHGESARRLHLQHRARLEVLKGYQAPRGVHIARILAMAIVAGAVAVASVAAAAAQPVDVVLARAAAYGAAYEEGLGSVIADERYRQDVSFPGATDPVGGAAAGLLESIRRRDLRSEFLLLRATGPQGLWLGLRDVLYVDGRPALDRAPLAFEEHAKPTVIRGSAGSDLPATGIIWVDPTSGRIIETELITDEPLKNVRTRITVKYRLNRKLGIWVPVEMTERYHLGPANSFAEQNIHCVATYSNFRRFEVDVKLRVPEGYD